MGKREPEQSPAPGLHVLALEANNFMRLRAVRVVPRGAVVEITGRNGSGKTSVLSAIWSSISGAANLPAEPLRQGAASGETFVDLGELRVTRTYSAAGTTALKVEARDGTRVKSPQAVLDKLAALVAFDPLDFAQAPPAEQAALLRRMVKLDTADLDRRQADLNAERADLTKSLRAQEYEYQAFGPDEDWAAIPDEPVSLAEITGRLKDAHAARLVVVQQRTAYRDLKAEQAQRIAAQDKAQAEVDRLYKRLEEAKAAAVSAKEAVWKVSEEIERRRPVVEALADPDTGAIEQEIAASETVNRNVRQKQERKALAEAIAGNKDQANRVAMALQRLKLDRAARLAACEFPVAGLGFDDDGTQVLYRGVPVSQASTAEAIVLGLGVAAAMSPRLRVARIKDGSLLDDDTLAAVGAWAAANDFQIWLETVGGPNSPTGVVIEDGEVLADRQPGEPKAAPPRFGATALSLLDDPYDPDAVPEADPLEGPTFTGR